MPGKSKLLVEFEFKSLSSEIQIISNIQTIGQIRYLVLGNVSTLSFGYTWVHHESSH